MEGKNYRVIELGGLSVVTYPNTLLLHARN